VCPSPLGSPKRGTQDESVKITLTGTKTRGHRRLYFSSLLSPTTATARDRNSYLVRGLTLRQVPPGQGRILLQQPRPLRGAKAVRLPTQHCQKQSEPRGQREKSQERSKAPCNPPSSPIALPAGGRSGGVAGGVLCLLPTHSCSSSGMGSSLAGHGCRGTRW